ncbi:MAG: outer membrane protein [Candidatus Acidiferrales bacterium]
MRRMACGWVFTLLVTFPMMAQDELPRWEVFGGYSYNNFDEFGAAVNLNGWNASLSWNPNRWLSFVGDFSGHYGAEGFSLILPPNPPLQLRTERRQHTFLFGPRFSYRGDKRFTPFAHLLFGVARFSSDPTAPFPFGFGFAATGLAVSLGGGIDIKVSDRFAVRAMQADLQILRSDFLSPHNFRYSAGIVFRWGKR